MRDREDLVVRLRCLCRRVYQRLYFQRRCQDAEFKIYRYIVNQKWIAANRQKVRTRQQQWCRLNADKRKEYQARDYEKHGEKRRAENRRRRSIVPFRDRHRALSARWKREHPERVRENHRTWYKRNKFKTILSNHRRRAQQAGSTVTPSDIHKLFVRQQGKCAYCRKRISHSLFHLDHVVPLARGGTNDLNNLFVACAPCNLSKVDRLAQEWQRQCST